MQKIQIHVCSYTRYVPGQNFLDYQPIWLIFGALASTGSQTFQILWNQFRSEKVLRGSGEFYCKVKLFAITESRSINHAIANSDQMVRHSWMKYSFFFSDRTQTRFDPSLIDLQLTAVIRFWKVLVHCCKLNKNITSTGTGSHLESLRLMCLLVDRAIIWFVSLMCIRTLLTMIIVTVAL